MSSECVYMYNPSLDRNVNCEVRLFFFSFAGAATWSRTVPITASHPAHPPTADFILRSAISKILDVAAWLSPPFWRTVPFALKATRAAGGGGGGGGLTALENGRWNFLPA